MNSAPTSAAARASSTSSMVLVVWPPITTGTRPAASSATAAVTATRSSKVMVEKSPAAPQAKRTPVPAVIPPSIRNRTWRRMASRSTDRSASSRNMVGTVT